MTDAEILDAVRRGEAGAFEAFAARYGRRLFAFGLRMCGQREDAEDVAQETLVKAFEGLGQVREPGAVRTWLFRVAANQCRSLRRKEPMARQVALAELGPAGDGAEQIPDGGALPAEAALRAETREALAAALLSLPSEARLVVLLRDVEGFSTRETATALGLGESAVKMRLARARHQLRQRLGPASG